MAISKGLILKIFSAADIQRWNDKLRPMELTELDKQAHKMIIAYVLGKFEENGAEFNWQDLIEGGIFEFLQRIELTDLKPPVFYKIKEHREEYDQLKKWAYKRLSPVMTPLGKNFVSRFKNYFSAEDEGVSRRIVGAAHFYATKWEFDIIKRMNPVDFEIPEIERNISSRQQVYSNVKGIQQLNSDNNLRRFIDLSGQLRFQLRWGNIRRVTSTSVLGHMLVVAILAYLFSLEVRACPKRCVNNFLTGLFHDLPEVLTRDIISPVKGSVEGISDIVKEYEKEQMKDKIYSILPLEWHSEMRIFAEDEFSDLITIDQQAKVVSSAEIKKQYNKDEFNPRDGSLVKACDDLAAFTEAYLAVRNGVTAEALHQTISNLKEKYKNKLVAGINFGQIYADFD